ncbi:MAG: hypothetical protein PSV22_17285 [Pseudolabrys sp.]|nr:hypothetical protein [Pseudolabrys sp.]
MTDKRPTPDASAGKSRPKRAAPTIDLIATEMPGEAPKAAAGTPPHDPVGDTAPAAAGPASAPPPSGTAEEPRKSSGFAVPMPVLAAGLAGAAAMSLVMLALWLSGLVPIRYAGSTAMRARVTGLEMQLQDLQKRPANVADTKAVDGLTQRVAKMEESLAKLPSADPARAERVAAADNAMKSLGVALAALNRRSDDIAANTAQARERAEAADNAVTDLRGGLQDVSKAASAGASSADLEPLQQRIAALEQSAKTALAEIAKASASDTTARLALSAATLRDSVLRGAPFTEELAQAKSLGADGKLLAPLVPFAASGLPSEKTLAAELSALLPGMIKAAGAPPPSANFIERLQANASQLVRVRPVDAPAGDDSAAVLARLDFDVAHADIAAALADLGKLTEAQRAPAQGWFVKTKARQAALAAARQIATEAARSLGSK